MSRTPETPKISTEDEARLVMFSLEYWTIDGEMQTDTSMSKHFQLLAVEAVQVEGLIFSIVQQIER